MSRAEYRYVCVHFRENIKCLTVFFKFIVNILIKFNDINFNRAVKFNTWVMKNDKDRVIKCKLLTTSGDIIN